MHTLVTVTDHRAWFALFDGDTQRRDLTQIRDLATPELIDTQDDWGMTALHLAVVARWHEAVAFLLEAGANTQLRYHRSGDTPLHAAVVNRAERLIRVLLAAGANADAANHSGLTPREAAEQCGMSSWFAEIAPRPIELPPWRVQNAEHLADYYYPDFQLPERGVRETLLAGQTIEVHVYGPRQPRVRVRILRRTGAGAATRYTARVDPGQETNLPSRVSDLELGPEHVSAIVAHV